VSDDPADDLSTPAPAPPVAHPTGATTATGPITARHRHDADTSSWCSLERR